MLQGGRPRRPVSAVAFGQGTEGGEPGEDLTPFDQVGVEAVIAAEAPADRLERLRLERPDPVAVDEAILVERPPGRRQSAPGPAASERPRRLHRQVERVQEAAAAREVRTGLLGPRRAGGVQRVDQHKARAQPSRPSAQAPGGPPRSPEAPAPPGAGGIELGGKSPSGSGGRGQRPGLAMTARAGPPSGGQPVVAGRQIDGQLALDPPGRAVLKRQSGQRGRAPAADPGAR